MADYIRTKPMALTGAILAVVAYIWQMAVANLLTSLPMPVGNIITWGVLFGVAALVYNKVQMV